MSKGLKIAKPGFDIHAASENLYVDTDNSLLKVHKYGSGSVVFDGVTRVPTYRGTGFTGVTTDDVPHGYFVTMTVPHNLKYTPLFMIFMDAESNSKRQYITNISGGEKFTGFGSADANQLMIQGTPYILPGDTIPLAGEYGFFYYIFKERMTPPELYPYAQ